MPTEKQQEPTEPFVSATMRCNAPKLRQDKQKKVCAVPKRQHTAPKKQDVVPITLPKDAKKEKEREPKEISSKIKITKI
jgi:hypothetical protein